MRTFRLTMAVQALLFLTCLVVSGCVVGGRTSHKSISAGNSRGDDLSQLMLLCGAAGLNVNFVTKKCMTTSGTDVPLARSSSGGMDIGQRNSQLVFACGAAGMGVDFVTGNCVPPSGGQINPRNVAPPSAPLPPLSPGDLIMRCGGRAVDFVTGRCM